MLESSSSQLARAPETFKLFFVGDASTAASARALTWHAPRRKRFLQDRYELLLETR